MDTFPWLECAFLDYKNRHSLPKFRSYSSLCEESNGKIKYPTEFYNSFQDL